MPTMGVFEPAISRATPSMVPSPPKTISRSAELASLAVSSSSTAVRPDFSMRATAARTRSCEDSFSGFATSPTRVIVSANFFKQHQKFFVPGRTQQRRFGDARPTQGQLCLGKCPHLAQDTLMHRRISDHPGAFVGLSFARLELRLDQRHDLTGGSQQSNGRGKDFLQRDEG